MKGALYVLGSKLFANAMIYDWRHAPRFMLAILRCQHQEKPSIQNLIKGIATDFFARLVEPNTIRSQVESPSLQRAAKALSKYAAADAYDAELRAQIVAKADARVKQKDVACAELIPVLLQMATDPQTHWRYAIVALRFIRALIRRDQPLSVDIARYLADQLVSELPSARAYAYQTMTKFLFFVKLRTLAASPEDVREKPVNELTPDSCCSLRRRIRSSVSSTCTMNPISTTPNTLSSRSRSR